MGGEAAKPAVRLRPQLDECVVHIAMLISGLIVDRKVARIAMLISGVRPERAVFWPLWIRQVGLCVTRNKLQNHIWDGFA